MFYQCLSDLALGSVMAMMFVGPIPSLTIPLMEKSPLHINSLTTLYQQSSMRRIWQILG